MKKFRTCPTIGGLIALLLLFVTLPAYATAISNPDTPPGPTLTDIHANRNLYVSGDMLIYGMYNLPYATLPTTVDPSWTAANAFIFRLISTDGVTELGTITPYVYFDSGYRQGAFSLYFTAGAIPWGESYVLRISENPALFATPLKWDTSGGISYTTFTSQADNQVDLADKIAILAHALEDYHSGYTLLATSAGRTILSSSGENYFRGAIPGLEAMAPSLYFVQSSPIDYTSTNWTTANFDVYASRFNGTWIGDAEIATAAQFGLPRQLIMSIPILILCLFFVAMGSFLVRKFEPGWICSTLMVMMGAILGWVPMAIFALIFQTLLFYLAWMWLGSKQQWISFIAVMWFGSTLICLILEGSYFTTSQNTIASDLAILSTLNAGNLLAVPNASMTFFRGLVRMFLFDYSFYSGGYVVIRFFWVLIWGSAFVYDIVKSLTAVYAGFIARW